MVIALHCSVLYQRHCMQDTRFLLQALKNVMTKLAEVGQSASIVEVVYKYMELLEGKSGDSATTVEMTLASEESAAEVENKKAMLCAPCYCCGLLFSSRPRSPVIHIGSMS